MKSHRWFDSSVDDCEIVNRIVLFVSYLLLLRFRVLPASENTHYTHIRIFRAPPNHQRIVDHHNTAFYARHSPRKFRFPLPETCPFPPGVVGFACH